MTEIQMRQGSTSASHRIDNCPVTHIRSIVSKTSLFAGKNVKMRKLYVCGNAFCRPLTSNILIYRAVYDRTDVLSLSAYN